MDESITEIISEDEPIINKKVRKQKKIYKELSKRQDIEKEEITTESITKVEKKMKEKKSNIEITTIPDETTYEFNLEKYPAVAPTFLKTSKTVNEAIAHQEAVELSTDINDVCDKAQINVITRNAAESIITQGEEKEETRKESLNVRQFKANSVLELNESLVTRKHPETQSPLEDIPKSLDMVPCIATKDILPKESLSVHEIYPDQTLGEETDYQQQNKKAKFSIVSHSQKVVTEYITPMKEGEIKPEPLPQVKKATKDFVEHESINVIEVNEAHSEKKLNEDVKPTPVKSTVEYPLNEQLTISELYSEIMPENYYPEVIVPTEVADKIIVPSKNAITTFEIEASETEINYNSSQSPIGYKADVSIIPRKSIQITESNVQEKETKLVEDKTPDKYFAVTDIVAQPSIIVDTVNQQEKEKTFISHIPESHTAILTLNNANKVCTSSIIEMNEAESDLKIPITPEMKQIISSVLGLEVPDTTEVIANETEVEFISQSTLELLPGTSFVENQSYIVTETTTDDSSTDFKINLNYKTDEATPVFEEVVAKQIYQANVHDSDIPLDETVKPTSVKPETSFAPIQSVTVEQTVVAEQEQPLVLKTHPELHKSNTVPTHTLQAVNVEIILTENCVENLKNNVQSTTKIANVNFVDDHSIVVKEVSAFESESSLVVEGQPKNLQANPSFSGHDVAEITEVISNDAIEQLNIENYPKDTANLEHVPYQAFVSEVTAVNELEDVLVKKNIKQPKTVNVTVDEVIGVNVSEQPIYEKELFSIEQATQKTKNASTEFVPIEIAERSEIIAGDYTLDLLQPDISKFHAYHQPYLFESIISSETDVSEKEQNMLDKKSHLTCSANTTMVFDEAVEITEIVSDSQPEEISVLVMPKEETAQPNIIPLKAAESENVMTCENVENVEQKLPVSAVAHLIQKPLNSLETTLTVLADSENLMSTFIMPDLKVAETNITELDIPISVVEILAHDNEVEFKADDIPPCQLDKQDIILEKCHETLETVLYSSSRDFDELIPQSVFAITSKSPQVAIELSETALLEKEGKLLADDISYVKHAAFKYEEAKGIQITEQIQLDTKDELVLKIKPMERKTNITILGQDIAETSETKVESPIEELKIEFPMEELANIIQDKEVHSFEVSEIITQETESSLVNSQQNNSKTINITIEDNSRSYVVSEIIPKEKEGQLIEQPKPIKHHADQDILGYEGLQINEINTSVHEENLKNFEYSTKTGNKVIEPFECIEVSEVNVQELEGSFIQSAQPQIKHATHGINENIGLIIKSTVTNDKEDNLTIDKYKTKTATKVSNLLDYKAPEKYEKTTLESVKPIEDHKEDLHQALSEHILLEGISMTTVNAQENEVTFDHLSKAASKTASIEYETEQTIGVIQVFLGESETDFIPTSLPQKHIALRDVSETQRVASSFEVFTQNATDDLHIQTLPSTLNIMPLSTETQSINVMETTCHETETPFNSVKNLTKNCNFTIQMDQNIEITEVITNELEEPFKTHKKNKSSEANIIFDENQTVTIEEVEISNDVVPLTDLTFQPSSAKQQYELLVGVSVTEVRPEEAEIMYEEQLKPLSKHVTPVYSEQQSLNVTSTLVDEKENVLDNLKPEITQNAQISSIYRPMSVVQLEENNAQICTTDLKTTKPNEIFVESSQISFDSINQLEISPYEKEGSFDTTPTGKKEVANMNMDTINILDTTEIITGDKESIYMPLSRPDVKHANFDLTDSNPVGKVFEVRPEDSASELMLPSVIKFLATPGQEVLHGVLITNTELQDKEEIFEGDFYPVSSVAQVNIENEKEITTITEVITQEMEGNVKKLNIPSAKRAQIELTSGQEVAEKIETLPNTALGLFTNTIAKSSIAIPVQDTFESIQATITVTEDKEKPLISNLTYEKSTAKLKLKESKSVNVTEVVVEDKEGKYIAPDLPKKQNAGKNILPTEATEISVVVADVHVTEFDKFEPKQESANVAHETYTNIEQIEITVHDNEKYFEPNELVTKKAELTMIPNKSLIITEIITDDNDEKLHIKHENKTQQASTSLTTLHEVPQVSEIISSFTTSDVETTGINQDNALVSESDLCNSTILTEVNVFEKENVFSENPIVDKYKVEVTFLEDKSLNVSETVLDENEQPLEINKSVKKQAILTQSTFDGVEISENSSVEVEQYFGSTKIPESQTVSVSFENNLNVQVSEICTADKENDLITAIEKSQTATMPEINTHPTLNITEVITSMNVTDLPQTVHPDHSLANETHFPCQSILQTELNISESEGVLEQPKISKEKAIIKTDVLENIISTEQVVSEKEGILKKEKNADYKHAKASLEEIKSSIIVSDVIIEEKEIEISGKPTQKTSTANVVSENLEAIIRTEQHVSEKEDELNLNIPMDEIANMTFEDVHSGIIVSKVIPEDKEDNLVFTNKSYSTAKISTENYESIVRNEQFISEKEENITHALVPDNITASVSIEKPQKGAIVTEITSNEKESNFEKIPKRKSSLATISTEELKSLTISDTQIMSNVNEIKTQVVKKNTATMKINEFKHLTVEELVTNENESTMNEKLPIQHNIRPTVIELIPLESNEIISETQPIQIEEKKSTEHKAKLGKPTKNKSIKVNEDMIMETTVELKQEPMDKHMALVTDTTLSTGINILNLMYSILHNRHYFQSSRLFNNMSIEKKP